MSRIPKPFTTPRRLDTDTFQITLNPVCGLPVRVCAEWRRTYRGYWDTHIKDDPFTALKMAEVKEEDATEYITRLAVKKLADGRPCGGTRTFAGVIIFIRMAFREYQRKNKRWFNPFIGLDPPVYRKKNPDALPEDEMIRLFWPGVLKSTLELAVCACMFLSGLRRSEIFALKPEDLDWHTPKITVRRAWQNFNRKEKVLGPPKGKRERDAPFDPNPPGSRQETLGGKREA